MSKLLPKSQILAVHQSKLVSPVVDIKFLVAGQEVLDVLIRCGCLQGDTLCRLFNFLTEDTDAQDQVLDFLLQHRLIFVACIVRRLFNFLEMAQLTGQLAFAIQALGTRVDESVVSQNLSDFGQIGHVREVQTVVIGQVFVEDGASELHQLVILDFLIAVLAKEEADGLDLLTHDGARDDRPKLERLDEWRPPELLDHDLQVAIEAVECGPVERSDVQRLLQGQVLATHTGALDDLLALSVGLDLLILNLRLDHPRVHRVGVDVLASRIFVQSRTIVGIFLLLLYLLL